MHITGPVPIHISYNDEHLSRHPARCPCVSYACLCKLITRRAQLSGIVRWTKARFTSWKICMKIACHYWHSASPLLKILFHNIDCYKLSIRNRLLQIIINRSFFFHIINAVRIKNFSKLSFENL